MKKRRLFNHKRKNCGSFKSFSFCRRIYLQSVFTKTARSAKNIAVLSCGDIFLFFVFVVPIIVHPYRYNKGVR